jgi:hypothetical protein
MCVEKLYAAALLLCVTGVCAASTYVVPTTTLAAQTANNTSALDSFVSQTNGNAGAANVSKVDVHSLLYSGASTKIYAHMMLWFGGTNHMNVGYSSTDASQVHKQITDMISRGIDGVILDWYGPNNSIDDAAKLVMAEAESHPGFTFAIMIDQGAIQWYSCSGCTPQQALINDLQYVEQTYFPSSAYMKQQGRPVVTNFDVDSSYSVDWSAASAALSTQPVFLFQNNNGFTHVLSDGSYSWVMPTTTDYGMSYLASFYNTGMPLTNDETVGATYKGFNDTLAAWGSGRIMGQQCGQTWLQTFSKINSLYNSGKQLSAVQLVTWNDYEEATEIESGINNCLSVSAATSGNSLRWTINWNASTVDHYVAYISTDGQNLMSLADVNASTSSLNLCSYSVPNDTYTLFVQAVGKPSLSNQISAPVTLTSTCVAPPPPPPPPPPPSPTPTSPTLTLATSPSSLTISSGGTGKVTVTATPQSGAFNSAIALACSGLPQTLACSFSPASITPGGSAVSSVLTVAAASVAATNHRERNNTLFATWLFGFGLFGLTLVGKVQRKRIVTVLGACVLAAMIVGATSCGGASTGPVNTPSPVTPSPVATSYAVTIQGIADSVQLSTTVTVTVR